jgi:hypothetical protein
MRRSDSPKGKEELNMDVPGTLQTPQQEGEVARRLEGLTSRLPSDFFLWGGLASVATSLGFMLAGRKQVANFIGQWVPTLLLFGVYNKIVKIAGHDRFQQDVH